MLIDLLQAMLAGLQQQQQQDVEALDDGIVEAWMAILEGLKGSRWCEMTSSGVVSSAAPPPAAAA